MTFSSYRVAFSNGTILIVTVYLEPDGKIEQLLVEGKA
jgi:D-alanyl-D-alanine carboxypeptidase